MPRADLAEIVAVARSWLGTPWRHQGRLKGVAVDCGGLIIGVGRELGLLDFDTRAYGRIPDGQQLRALCEQHLMPKPVAEIAPGYVLLMRFTRHPQHLATREADALTIPLTAFPYNTREGTLFAEVSLDALPASSSADDRQHVAHLYGLDNESRWFFREDGLVFLGRRDGGGFSSHDNRLVIPGFAPGTVYRCAVAFTRDDFVIAVDGQLTALFAHPLGIADATELRIGRDGTSRFLDGHLRHLAYFPRRLEDDALRRVTV